MTHKFNIDHPRGMGYLYGLLCLAVVLCTLGLTGTAYSQLPPGTPGIAADSFEVDANFYSNVLPTGWPTVVPFVPTGQDWSLGASGAALLLQSGGHSVLGFNPATNSLWFRDPNWATGIDGTQYDGGEKNDDLIDSTSTHWGITDTTVTGGSPQKNDITNCYVSTQVASTG